MNTERAYRRAEVADEVSKWTVGLGIVVMALFPLSLPILILTGLALAPLLLPLLAVGLVAAVVAVPVLLVRGLARRVGRRNQPRQAPQGPLVGRSPHSLLR